MTLTTLAVLGLAFCLELAFGEPPTAFHPVAWFGRVVALIDREWTANARHQRWLGLAVALVFPLAAAAAVARLVAGALDVHPTVGTVAAALVLFLTISLRRLLDLTRYVVDASETDLEGARQEVRGLVGRETETLTAAGIRSAAVESAGENLADGLVSTLLPFALLAPLSLPLAAGVAVWIKAVNTLDSMLGYRSKPIGTASARLDDLVMWIPARVSAVLVAVAAADLGSLARGGRWARVPASPNSGWPMATLACALDVRLEKPDSYVLNADARLPTVDDGTRAVRLVGRAGVLAIVLAVVLAVYSDAIIAAVVPVGEWLFDRLVDPVLGALERVLEALVALVRWLWRAITGVIS